LFSLPFLFLKPLEYSWNLNYTQMTKEKDFLFSETPQQASLVSDQRSESPWRGQAKIAAGAIGAG